MKKYKVTFIDEIDAENEDDAYAIILNYLTKCVQYEDVTAFEFKEIKKKKKRA